MTCKRCKGTGTIWLEGSIHGEDDCPDCTKTKIWAIDIPHGKTVKLVIENDNNNFVPVAQDHWWSDLLNNGKIYGNTICGYITFGKKQ